MNPLDYKCRLKLDRLLKSMLFRGFVSEERKRYYAWCAQVYINGFFQKEDFEGCLDAIQAIDDEYHLEWIAHQASKDQDAA